MEAKPFSYQFDDVRVDLKFFRVSKAGSPVQLEPKAFELLLYMIENRERLIEKKELLDAVWKDAFVTENAMTRVIAQLRKALGEDSKEAKYIETVPTRGYRFIAAVEVGNSPETISTYRESDAHAPPSSLEREAAAPPNATTTSALRTEHLVDRIKRHRPVVLLALALVIIAGVSIVYFLSQSTRQPEPLASPNAALK